jgi:hypothetical protein
MQHLQQKPRSLCQCMQHLPAMQGYFFNDPHRAVLPHSLQARVTLASVVLFLCHRNQIMKLGSRLCKKHWKFRVQLIRIVS